MAKIEPTPAMIKAIAAETRKHLAIGVAAQSYGLTPYQLSKFMTQGMADANAEVKTIYADFYLDIRKAQAEKAKELLIEIEDCPKKWQALAWKLQSCMREEFGTEAKEYKELLDAFKKLMEDVTRLKAIKSQGVSDNG